MTTNTTTATTTTSRRDQAERFHALHGNDRHGVLVLPNAWDAASAMLVERAGAHAVATTSAGVAWALGVADGERLDRAAAVRAVARIAAAVSVPVTADVEGGYAADAAGVGETVRAVLDAGAVGVNIEDADRDGTAPLLTVADQTRRIRAARLAADTAGTPLFVNARTDVYLCAVGDPANRLADAVARAAAYLDAGADGIFVPGLAEPDTIEALAHAVAAPLNILAGPGSPTVAELARLGVARVSLGSAIAEAAYGLVLGAAREALTEGTYTVLTNPANAANPANSAEEANSAGALDYGQLNALYTD